MTSRPSEHAPPAKEVYRFCIKQNSKTYELFSARLTTDGTIILSLRPDDVLGEGINLVTRKRLPRMVGRVSEDRYSIHPSIGKDAISIKHTERIEGQRITAKLMIDATVENVVAVPFTKAQGCMSPASPILSEDRKGTRVILDSMNDRDITQVIYTVVVCPAGSFPPELNGFSRVYRNIGSFCLNVYFCFPTQPTLGFCAKVSRYTFPIQIDNVPFGSNVPQPAANLKLSEVDAIVEFQTNQAMHAALNDLVANQPDMRKIYDIRLVYFDTVINLRKYRHRGYVL